MQRCLAGLSLFILLSTGIFYWVIPVAGAQTTRPVSGAKYMAVAEDSGDFFVLNGDGTVSVYSVQKDEFTFARVPLLGMQGLEITALEASRSGRYLAAVAVEQTTTRVALYSLKPSPPFAGLQSVNSYALPRSGQGSGAPRRFSPDEATLYLADSLSGNLFVLNVAKPSTKTVRIGGVIRVVETSADGKQLFLLTHNPDQLVIVNALDYSVIRRYDLRSAPTSMLYNDTLKRVFVSESGNDTVTVVDLGTGGTRESRVGKLPVSLAYDKASGNVFVANNGDGSLHVIAPDYTIREMDLGLSAYASYPILLWYSNQAKTLLALNMSARKLYFIDPLRLRVIKEEGVGGWAGAIRGGGSASRAAIHRANSNDLLLVDAKTIEIEYTSWAGETPSRALFSSPQGVVADPESGRGFVGNHGT